VLFDGGFAGAGEIYAEAIEAILGKRHPKILFLTHVHWDHCGAVSYLKRRFPSMRIAASKRAAEILKRRSAVELIGRLNANAESIVPALSEIDPSHLIDEPFQPFKIDRSLEDGDVIRLEEGLSVEVLATPGHTRDHLSYYIPEKKILVAAEASGCLDSQGEIITEFLADYDAYVSSLKRLAGLPVEILCQGHRIVFVGQAEVRAFFSGAVSESIRFGDRVYELLEAEAGDLDRVIVRIKAEKYDTNKGVKQPEAAYLLNLRAQVTHLAEKRSLH
jgi:glyoxylase-like metal-dependent hydrolase (beta-lactamase superfamily II)